MSRRRFERLVARAIRDLPPAIRDRLDNVDIVIEDRPGPEHLMDQHLDDNDTLFGLYQGTPLTARTSEYGLVLPDKITIFQEPLEAFCSSDYSIRAEVQTTVIHELAHHVGLSDDDLDRLGLS